MTPARATGDLAHHADERLPAVEVVDHLASSEIPAFIAACAALQARAAARLAADALAGLSQTPRTEQRPSEPDLVPVGAAARVLVLSTPAARVLVIVVGILVLSAATVSCTVSVDAIERDIHDGGVGPREVPGRIGTMGTVTDVGDARVRTQPVHQNPMRQSVDDNAWRAVDGQARRTDQEAAL